MHSVLVVTTPASDRSLLTQAERREAIGVTDSSQDTKLAALDLRLGAAIVAECRIAIGAGAEPTLLQETLTETCRRVDANVIVLARRHNVEITSLIEDGATLNSDVGFTVDPESGLVTRLSGDCPRRWCAAKVVVVYKAGFVTVPGDLKMAAMDFMRLAWSESGRDPALKSLIIDEPDVERIERTWWVGSVPGQSNEGAVPDIVAGQLARFRNYPIG
ncbi:hypothetical protein [Mesorhizobium sp. M6A.T.Ce.TU.016.01.1.1]|uniref:hypothetical protein n=1 Tax=Mesorhizobium sp. M6A.T.Ce.TU.016.01.1.1 TaxID=2496783 RepID=UPI000FCB33CF|nr:hypothetical protein [Mesorhizobium sp. M6A.T.Ce.TU.016.01.1.1]RUU29760.1 hypothetical protein EOC94_12905 [Mesorhizobium sp. M6A.T.Ce.TU.016.01.1.1]